MISIIISIIIIIIIIYIHRNDIHISTYIYINQHDSIVMPELDQRKVALNNTKHLIIPSYPILSLSSDSPPG